ncbi:MAG: hypothetical protein LDL19_11500 [Thiobacillus sp.]|nr:hypothetical protein [Thiobacillus sp.]
MTPSRPVFAAKRALLWILVVLFLLRILAQPLANFIPVLPPFEAWQGSRLPYPVLLAFQLAILAAMVATTLYTRRAQRPHRPRLARALTLMGAAYFAAMFARLVAGAAWEDAPLWFQRPLPAIFHLVLASWLLLIAREFGKPRE